MNLRDNRPPPSESVQAAADGAPAADPPLAEPTAVEAAPTTAPAGSPASFDPWSSEIDDPVFRADEVVGGLSREELLALPEPAKKTVAAMRRDYTRKTQALAEERKALEAERAKPLPVVPAAPTDPAERLASALAATGHAPLDVLLGRSDDWSALPLPKKLALDDLSDDDLYDPAKFRAAMRESIDHATRARTQGGFKAFVEPFLAEQERAARRSLAEKWIASHEGMDARENRDAVRKIQDDLGVRGEGGLNAAWELWRARTKPVAATPAPAPTQPQGGSPADPEVERLRRENATLRAAAARAPLDIARDRAAAAVSKGGRDATGSLPKMPENMDPMARAQWLRDHPDVADEIRRGGLRGRARMRENGLV